MMDIDATDLVTVRRDDLLAMESEIKELREARDAAVLVASVYQAQADAEHEQVVQLINRVTEVQLERGLLERQLADAQFTIGKERKNRKRNKLSANVCIDRIRDELERRDDPGDKLHAIRDIVEGV